MGTSGVVLLLLAIGCWLGMLATFPGFLGVQAHGDASVGVAMSFLTGFVFAGFTWLWIGGLLLVAGTRGLLPGWQSIAALVLGPAAAAATMAALYLLSDPRLRWPAAIPVVAPLLLAGYVCALSLPSLRPFFSAPAAAPVVWLLALALSIAPWPTVVAQFRAKAIERVANAAARAEREVQERERKHAENVERLKTMPPGAPLENWYPLLEGDSGMRAKAIEALRHDPSRQAQIEERLPYGLYPAMTLLPELDLQATPSLCQAAGTFLVKTARSSHRRKRDDPAPYTAEMYFIRFVPAIRWLIAHGCNCDEGIAALDASARTYLDSPDRQKLLAELDALRQH